MRSYDRAVFVWITRGAGRFTARGLTRGLGPHHGVFLPAGCMHGFHLTRQAMGHMVFLSRASLAVWPEAPLHLKVRDTTRQAAVTGRIDALARELREGAIGAERAAFCHEGLLSVLIEREAALAGTTRPASPSEALAARFFDLVARDHRSGRPLASYADELGVSAEDLSGACMDAVGRAAHQIIFDHKVNDPQK